MHDQMVIRINKSSSCALSMAFGITIYSKGFKWGIFQIRTFEIQIITGRNEVVAKVMFLHVCVILFTGGVLRAGRTPPDQTPPGSRHPPWSRHPPDQTPPSPPDQTPPPSREQTPPQDQTPPPPEQRPPTPTPLPREADSGIRSMSGRYASYWNAFLLSLYVGVIFTYDTVCPCHVVGN